MFSKQYAIHVCISNVAIYIKMLLVVRKVLSVWTYLSIALLRKEGFLFQERFKVHNGNRIPQFNCWFGFIGEFWELERIISGVKIIPLFLLRFIKAEVKTKRNELKEEIKKLEQSLEDYGNKVRKKIAELFM